MTVRTRLVPTLLLALSMAVAAGAATPDGPVAWPGIGRLIGSWHGEGVGTDGDVTVEQVWEPVLGDHFLRLETRLVAKGKGGADDVHEDVGYLSRVRYTGHYVFRQFLSEGYVNVYDVALAGGGRALVFAPRESGGTGGTQARMRLEFNSPDAYEMYLDLEAPDAAFKLDHHVHMTRDETSP